MNDAQLASKQVDDLTARFRAVTDSMSSRLIGRDDLTRRLLIALLTGGHVLIEGAPGLAKTRAVNLFAQSIDTTFSRVQATPDLLPADLTGTNVFRQESGDFDFVPGPLFANVVLVDEINRAPPKVQSALLEAMAERQITVSGTTHHLAEPFLVAATQNPLEHEGTYPLPEAQLDRFLFFVQIPMPEPNQEAQILDLALTEANGLEPMTAHVNAAQIARATSAIAGIHVATAVRDYAVRLTAATRGLGAGGAQAADIEYPASPRATIGMVRAAQAAAWLDGRNHVVPDDVTEMAADVLSGRVSLNYRARAEGQTTRAVIEQIIGNTPAV